MGFKPKDYLKTPKGKRLAKWLVGIPLGYTLLGFFALPPLVRYIAEGQLTKILGRTSTIGKVRFNPWTLALEIEDLRLRERDSDEAFVAWKRLRLDAQIMSLFKLAPVVREITLSEPTVRIVRTGESTFNFTDILEKLEKDYPPSEPDPNAKPFRYSINNITLGKGRIDIADLTKDSKHSISDLDLGVPFISNMPASIEIDVVPSFAAKIDDAAFNLTGKTRPFANSKETSLNIDLEDFALPEYQKYVPIDLAFKLTSAKLTTRLTVAFIQSDAQKPRITVTGLAALKDVELKDLGDTSIFKLPLFETQLKSAELFPVEVTIDRILVQDPELHVARDRSGVINLSKLIPAPKKAAAPPAPAPAPAATAEPDEPARFTVVETRLQGGRVTWHDQQPEPGFETELNPIELTIQDLGNHPNQAAKVDLNVSTKTGETLKHQGTLTLAPLAAQGNVDLANIVLPNFAPYYAGKLPCKIEDAKVVVKTGYKFQGGEPAIIKAEGLDVVLSTLRLRQPDSDHDFFSLPELHVTDTAIDVAKQTVMVGQIATAGGKLDVRRDKAGVIDVTKMAPPAAPAATDTAPPPPPPQGPVWTVNLNKFALQKYGVSFQDAATTKAVTTTVEPIDVNLANFSTTPGTQAQVDLKLALNKNGTVAVAGPLKLEPLTTQLKIDVKGVELLPLRAYVPENIKLALAGGAVATGGTVQVEKTADAKLKVRYTGNASVNKFSAVEKAGAQDLLKWNALAINGIDVQTEPLNVVLKEVRMDGLFSAVKIAKDGVINLTDLVEQDKSAATAKPAPEDKDAAAKSAATQIEIDKIKLTGSTVAITDQQVTPSYTAKLANIDGNVGKISTGQTDPTALDLKAMLNGHSPLQVKGKIKPLSQELFADVKIDFKDIDVNSLSPYTVKFVGYPLQQGKLSLDLKYLLEKRALNSHNQVFIDQLALGKKVDSPGASSLPVETAVTLLKNRKGEINIDLPVQGSLDDPKFSVLGILGDVLVNLITKAALAPFSLISSAFGGGEDLGYVDFEHGDPTLTQGARDKLMKLAQALGDRPELKVEIVSLVDAEQDKTGAVAYRVRQLVLDQKRAVPGKQDKAAEDSTDLQLEGSEYDKYLALAYAAADFKKPRNFIGIAKELPREEMEKLIRDNTTISSADLEQLGVHRAEAVRDFLIKQQVDNGRIFLGATKVAPATADAKGSRVNFEIK